ncbi:hypothetical protein [Clostridium estertheticum]|uniref:hypothetical protein n=1 Tax=Clostridium estertheticum TaxID=238834 RepID=UPI001CF37D3C|nr:hypothetical protein [Clostridium estertheticum]MCB2353539.1 hypothetical protein [Clostridium estertheticum]WAG41874.1 hypothetical protein LL065_03970 [Clostridium estertheticum]
MNKKITSTALATLMIAGSTSFSAFASMDIGTVVIGTKAFDLSYANDPVNAADISAAITAGGAVYIKDFNGKWVDNVSGATVNASVIPAVTYKNATGTTNYGVADTNTTTSTAATSSTASVTSASTFKVVFNGTVADTSKVVFTTKRGTTAIDMAVTWNASKTEAILTYASNLPVDSYTVNVVNNAVDFGTSTLAITQQKVAKISIIGDTLAVDPTSVSTAGVMVPGEGFVSYKVFDQYGVDITDSSLASSSNINWNSSIGETKAVNGLITIKSYSAITLLTQYTTAIITAIDSDSSLNASSTLKVSLSQGTIGNITLNTLTNADGKVLTQGDSVSKFYLDYTATDVSGNDTKSKRLLDKGLLDSDTSDADVINLYLSNPSLISAKLVEDPNDSSKAVIEVTPLENASTIYADTPIIITAMTKSGKSSSVTVTLKKATTLDSLAISLPSNQVAVGDTDVEVPYKAYDQAGKALTKYSEIVGSSITNSITNSNTILSATTGLQFTKNADGTLKITIDKIKAGTSVYQIVTKTGKNSMITVKAQDAGIPDALSIDTTSIKQYMQKDAIQKLDFGADAGGLSIKDQYGRAIDLTKSNIINGDKYSVRTSLAGVTGGVLNNYSTTTGVPFEEAYNGNQIAIHASKLGAQTVKFTVYKTAGATGITTATDITKSITFTVVDDSDIIDFQSATIGTLYAKSATTDGYAVDMPDIFGKLSSGTLVALADASVANRAVSNSSFKILNGKVYANTIADGTTAKGTISSSLYINGEVNTITTALNSSSVEPSATSVGVSVTAVNDKQGGVAGGTLAGSTTGVTISGDTITATPIAMQSLMNRSIYKFDENIPTNHGNVCFYALDQYGTKGSNLSFSKITNATGSPRTYAVDSATGILTSNGVVSGDTFTLTVVAPSGATKTVKFVVSNAQ